MALTRAQVEEILTNRIGGWLSEAGLDGTNHNGSNASLNDPIGYAIRRLGGSVGDVTNISDADLSGIDGDDYDALFDLAEWRGLQNILKHLNKVDTRVGPLSQSYSQLRRDVLDAANTKRSEIETDYSLFGTQLEAGTITLDIGLKDADLDFVG